MAGKNLFSFADFVTATNEHVVTPPKDIISDAVLHTYAVKDMLRGKGESEVVKSGTKLTDRIQLQTGTQFGFYDPNEVFSPSIEDVLTKIESPWRFAKDCWGFTDHETMLNEGDRLVQYKSLRDSKRQASTISLYNGIENALWATPDTNTMESQTNTGGRPYSIRAFVTEDGNAPSGFTTIQQVNPTTFPKWKNQVQNYAYASIDSTLPTALEALWRKCKFESPDNKDSYFKETKFNKFKVYTNLDGWQNYVRLTRNANDRAVSGGGPDLGFATENPVFGGIPVCWIEALDSVGYSTGQPRYFFLNYEFMYPVFHSERYMHETNPINGGVGQPYSWVVYKDCWYNLFCRSRYRQGIAVPV